ncbi:hypothetical protein EC1_15240 [Faecalitalea cylindroides T2-87]|uniref:Uncharacterized protein n=1 Tax=Faecalitalea cylindroides T2-87 TaxID=717960 RepID=D4JFA1_9FIRM|nr:hypothetical protein EC1_15240 [Faecalitalea cylindroides T2-87]
MADHFLGALKEIERRSRDNTLIFSDVLSERLDGIAESMISTKLSDNDYMKLLELYYQKISQTGKEKGYDVLHTAYSTNGRMQENEKIQQEHQKY